MNYLFKLNDIIKINTEYTINMVTPYPSKSNSINKIGSYYATIGTICKIIFIVDCKKDYFVVLKELNIDFDRYWGIIIKTGKEIIHVKNKKI